MVVFLASFILTTASSIAGGINGKPASRPAAYSC
jgi:hypothetical protein